MRNSCTRSQRKKRKRETHTHTNRRYLNTPAALVEDGKGLLHLGSNANTALGHHLHELGKVNSALACKCEWTGG